LPLLLTAAAGVDKGSGSIEHGIRIASLMELLSKPHDTAVQQELLQTALPYAHQEEVDPISEEDVLPK